MRKQRFHPAQIVTAALAAVLLVWFCLPGFSFSDYHSFELNNLPSLQSIDISTWCFFNALTFSLTGLIDGMV